MNANKPDGTIDLSIVLINWNALELTSVALTTMQQHVSGITYEVFVVDNGSTKDQSVIELPRRFPWIRFIANSNNVGFCKASNQGMRAARGRYVLLLNNDTVQKQDAIGDSVRYMDGHLEVGGLGILHKNNDPECTFQPSFFPFVRPIREALTLLGLSFGTRWAPRVAEQDVDWACGSFLMIRRECLDQVGLLDERFFSYDEDADWCRRAHEAGWVVRFWPGVSMIHLGSAANPFLNDKSLVMSLSRITYLRKHHSAFATGCYYLAMGIRLALAFTKTTLRMLVGRAGLTEVRQKWNRFRGFALLRAGHIEK